MSLYSHKFRVVICLSAHSGSRCQRQTIVQRKPYEFAISCPDFTEVLNEGLHQYVMSHFIYLEFFILSVASWGRAGCSVPRQEKVTVQKLARIPARNLSVGLLVLEQGALRFKMRVFRVAFSAIGKVGHVAGVIRRVAQATME